MSLQLVWNLLDSGSGLQGEISEPGMAAATLHLVTITILALACHSKQTWLEGRLQSCEGLLRGTYVVHSHALIHVSTVQLTCLHVL